MLTYLPPPLVLTTSLYRGESLPSFCLRLELLNWYQPPTVVHNLITQCLRVHHLTDQIECPQYSATFDILAALSMVNVSLLHAGVPPTWARPYLRSLEVAQFCPVCLQEHGYHRWSWLLHAVTICCQHACFLVDRCPTCQVSLDILSIIRRTCAYCQSSLLNVAPEFVEEQNWTFSQTLIHAWLGVVEYPARTFQLNFPVQPPERLYAVLEAICLRLVHPGPQSRVISSTHAAKTTPVVPLTKLSPVHRTQLYTEAVEVLSHWPSRLLAFLNVQNNAHGESFHQGISTLAIPAYLEQFWHDEDYQFVQDALNYYLEYVVVPQAIASNHDHELLEDEDLISISPLTPPCITIERAATALQISSLLMELMIRGEQVATYDLGLASYIRRDDLQTLTRAYADGIPVSVAQSWLRWPLSCLVELVETGWLEAAQTDCSPSTWRLSLNSFDRVWTLIVPQGRFVSFLYHTWSGLSLTARWLVEHGVSLPDILDFVSDGTIRTVFTAHDIQRQHNEHQEACELRAFLMWSRQWSAIEPTQEQKLDLDAFRDWVHARRHLVVPTVRCSRRRYPAHARDGYLLHQSKACKA